jgi:WD40 repeat protein
MELKDGEVVAMIYGDKLISGSRLSSGDSTIKVWNTSTWTCEHTFEGHYGAVNCLVMHGDSLTGWCIKSKT